MHDLNKARIWWAPVSDPELYEDTLLEIFIKTAGSTPFAVLATPGGQRREHGLTGALHDEATPVPAKVTKVTRLPDPYESDMSLGKSSFRPRATRPASLAKPSRPRAAARKTVKAVPATIGPSAIETPVVRRSSKIAAGGKGGPSSPPQSI